MNSVFLRDKKDNSGYDTRMPFLRRRAFRTLAFCLAIVLGFAGCAGSDTSAGVTTPEGPRPGNSLDHRDQISAVRTGDARR